MPEPSNPVSPIYCREADKARLVRMASDETRTQCDQLTVIIAEAWASRGMDNTEDKSDE